MNRKKILRKILGLSSFSLLTLIMTCSSDKDSTPEESLDSTNPTVSIITPLDNDIQTTSFNILVNASDDIELEKVELYINNLLVGFDNSSPYEFTVNIDNYPSGQYIIKALAIDTSNNTASSEIMNIIALPSIDAPLNLNASKGEFGNKITLNWTTVPNADNYHVFKLNNLNNEYEMIGQTGNNTFEDANISEPLVQYFYKIRVFNSQTEFSDFSSIDYGYTNGDFYDVIATFGSEGNNNGQFLFNEHVSVDMANNIYVTDTNGNKIEKFDAQGIYIDRFQSISSPRDIYFMNNGNVILTKSSENKISIVDENGNLIKEWGSFGTGNGQFFYFRQITVDDNENIYVVDHNNHRIQKFDNQGNFILKWGQNGTNDGYFEYPWGIAVLNDRVIVSDNNGVQLFDLSGNFISKIVIPNISRVYDIAVKNDKIYLACQDVILKTDIDFEIIERIKDGYFTAATGIDINSNNNIIVSDTSTRLITVLETN